MPAVQVAEHFRLPPLHAGQVGGAGHVDVEEGATHQEITGLGRHVLGQLGQSLRRDHPGEPALAAAAHQVGHGAERQFSRFVGDFTGDGWGKQLGFVHHHQHRVPVVAVGIEHAAKEGRGCPHLLLDVEALEVHHARDAMLADTAGDPRQLALRPVALHHHMPILVGERDEIAFGIDDALLHPRRALFEQPAQQVRLAGPRVALHQQARREQFLKVEQGVVAALRCTHVD